MAGGKSPASYWVQGIFTQRVKWLEKKANFSLRTVDLYPDSKVVGEKTQLLIAYMGSLPRE
jgi:hypothetical protein